MLDLHREPDPGRDFILCDNCNGYIYREDEENYGDKYCKLEGKNVCLHCLPEYLKERMLVLT